MAPLTLAFQKRDLTPFEDYHLAQGKLNKLRMQYLGEEVKWSDKVSILLDNVSGEGVSVDTSSLIIFINILCLHLGENFLKMKIEEWSAFYCTAIAQCDFDFGNKNIRSLSLKYKHFLQEENVIIQQYNDFKFLVAEKIKSKLINSFPDMTMFAFQISLQN